MEGLEYNRRLSLTEFDDLNTSRNKTSDFPLKPRDRSVDKNPSSTFISKKVFIYTDLRNRSEIITRFRSGKFAPKRPVNGVKVMCELITIGTKPTDVDSNKANRVRNDDSRTVTAAGFDQTTDIKSTSSTSTNRKNMKPVKSSGNFFALIEWPGGRKTHTNKITINRDSGEPFSILDVLFGDFNDRNELGVQYNVINFMRGKPVKPFNKWISFASPPDNVASGRSQEYYTISNERVKINPVIFFNDVTRSVARTFKSKLKHYVLKLSKLKNKNKNENDVETVNTQNNQGSVAAVNRELDTEDGKGSMELDPDLELEPEPDSTEIRPLMNRGVAVMKYKRYGECPSWYSVGRSSASEIRATRYNSMNHIPVYAIALLSKNCPSFFESNSNNILDNFFKEKDLLEKYRPWYYFISKRLQEK